MTKNFERVSLMLAAGWRFEAGDPTVYGKISSEMDIGSGWAFR